MPTLSPQDFVAKWRKVELKERSAAQEHFLDLCRLVGHDPPAAADPAGTWFTFEVLAAKELGGEGFADVWKKGYFAWEYKGKHADLDRAYQQLLFYRAALQNPPLLIVSDIDSIVVRTNYTNTVQRTVTITLDDLLTAAGIQHLRNVFFHPEAFKSPQTTAEVTERAAAEFARIADLLRRYGTQPRHAAHFLIQVLFCLFAEDCALLPAGLFTRLVRQAQKKPAAFGVQLGQLFQAMADGGWFGADEIAHFNGRLFATVFVPLLDSDSLAILAGAAALDWSSIEPAILGTLFERSLDPAKRSQLGAHYTSREDILLIVEPVLMAPLRRRWDEVREQARALAAKRDAAAGAPRARLQKQLQALLLGFISQLASIRVLDPACGSGNFLYVALRLLLDLEKEVGAEALALGLPRPQLAVSPAQLHGIELNEYAFELAQATVWIGYIQWLRENGYGSPGEPILKPLDTFRPMDAILAYDDQGRPAEPAWPAVDVIVGNPPFLGGNKIRQGLGDRYVDDLFALYKDRVPAFADLVCYWHEKARAQIAAGKAQRAGLLATNSIRQQQNRPVLQRIKETGDIFMAWSDRPWVLDGAAVRVSMVGFDNGSEPARVLDNRHVAHINADLTSGIDVAGASRLQENQGICFMGPSAKGPFEISEGLAQVMLRAPRNINGRPNADVVRPVANAADLVQEPRRLWTIDFGLMSLEEAVQYEMPFEYVKENVYPVRSKNRRAAYAQKWWQYAEARPGMRAALKGKERYIATPGVARHRLFVWVCHQVLCNQRNQVFARDDDYFFGILQSHIHEVWSLATGSWQGVGNDPVYNSTACFETYPFPWPPGQEPAGDPRVEAIAAAARELVRQRDAWLNPPGAAEVELKKRTLTNLYNQRPTWLQLAHRKLDGAVLDAYGWPRDLGEEELLERLLALNRERAAGQAG